jgi:solute:Na+ symporter, SSS family
VRGNAAANVRKWHWWRFNGYGYFWGVITGTLGTLLLFAVPGFKPLTAFPMLLLVSTVGSIAGSLLTRQQDMTTLVSFYSRTRPWGWWGPVQRAAAVADPRVELNRELTRDMFNVIVGVVWQTAFVALPIYVVIRDWRCAGASAAMIAITSIILTLSLLPRFFRLTSNPRQLVKSAPSTQSLC